MTPGVVSAPGKAFLCGEYAVIEGAPAIVSAIGRRVFVRWDGRGDGRPPGPEAEEAFRVAQQELGKTASMPTFDRQQLFHEGTKLGLGSSAAASVAVAGAVAAQNGHDLDDPGVLRKVFHSALSGHEAVAPDGSGADVAAATYGGFVTVRRRSGAVDVTPLEPPPSLHLSLIWTGSSSRTSDLLRQVRGLRSSEPTTYRNAIAVLCDLAAVFTDAFRRGDVQAVVGAARDYHVGMRELGRAADAPIVNTSLDRIAQLATREGGASKPCGAGGGDVAVAFFGERSAAERFGACCVASGLMPVAVQWGAPGAQTEDPDAPR